MVKYLSAALTDCVFHWNVVVVAVSVVYRSTVGSRGR